MQLIKGIVLPASSEIFFRLSEITELDSSQSSKVSMFRQ